MSKIYIKHPSCVSNTYSYDNAKHVLNHRLNYKVTLMEGPFESLAEAIEQIRSACYNNVEIVEFEE